MARPGGFAHWSAPPALASAEPSHVCLAPPAGPPFRTTRFLDRAVTGVAAGHAPPQRPLAAALGPIGRARHRPGSSAGFRPAPAARSKEKRSWARLAPAARKILAQVVKAYYAQAAVRAWRVLARSCAGEVAEPVAESSSLPGAGACPCAARCAGPGRAAPVPSCGRGSPRSAARNLCP